MKRILNAGRPAPSRLQRQWLVTTGFIAAVLLGGVGCGEGEDPFSQDCDGCGGPSTPATPSAACIEADAPTETFALIPGVFTGDDAVGYQFEAIQDGDLLDIVFGGQGGSHLELGVRTYGELAEGATVHVTVDQGDTPWSERDVEAVGCDGGWSEVSARVFDPPSGEAIITMQLIEGDVVVAESTTSVSLSN